LGAKSFPVCSNGDIDNCVENETWNLEDKEREMILSALQKKDGNQTKAAEMLGISRHTLIRRLEKYGEKNF